MSESYPFDRDVKPGAKYVLRDFIKGIVPKTWEMDPMDSHCERWPSIPTVKIKLWVEAKP